MYFSKSSPNLAKSCKAEPSLGQEYQRKRLGFPLILLSEMSLLNGLRRPPPHFFLFSGHRQIKARMRCVVYARDGLAASGAQKLVRGFLLSKLHDGSMIAGISTFRKD